MSLVDIHNKLSSHDQVLEKEAAIEWEKVAEEDAAGRIMARGFWDEMNKLADDGAMAWPRKSSGGPTQGASAKSGAYQTKAPQGSAMPSLGGRSSTPFSPPAERAKATNQSYGDQLSRSKTPGKVTLGGNIAKASKPPAGPKSTLKPRFTLQPGMGSR